jgi:hypothetical protein
MEAVSLMQNPFFSGCGHPHRDSMFFGQHGWRAWHILLANIGARLAPQRLCPFADFRHVSRFDQLFGKGSIPRYVC